MVRLSISSAVRRFEERVVPNGLPRWKKLVRSELHGKNNGAGIIISRRRVAEVKFIDPRGRFAFVDVFARRTSGGDAVKAVIPREHFPRNKRLHRGDRIVFDLLRGTENPVGCKVEILPRGSVVRVP